MNAIEVDAKLEGEGLKCLLVVSRFNDFITDKLAQGAEEALRRHGVAEEDITLVRVPGALEIAPVLRRMGLSGAYDVAVALGCVIRGGTYHFEVVVNESARAIGTATVELAELGVGVGFGVLTTNTIEQAIERAGTKAGNKGADAALVGLEMAQLYRRLGGRSRPIGPGGVDLGVSAGRRRTARTRKRG